MCLAIYKKAGQKIPYSEIKTSWLHNSDGAGLCIRGAQKVEVYKGFMSQAEFIDFLRENEELFEAHDALIHMRYSTCATVTPGLTHPFPVTEDKEILKALTAETDRAIVHNGVLFTPKGKELSDTAIFSRWLARKERTPEQIKGFIKSDRLAIMDRAGVTLYGDWTERNGIMYSNTYSLASYGRGYYSNTWGRTGHATAYDGDDYYWDREAKKWVSWSSHLGNVTAADAKGMADADTDDAEDDVDDWDDSILYCMSCGSGNTVSIGQRAIAMECNDCGCVYNETHYMEGALAAADAPEDDGPPAVDEFLQQDYGQVQKYLQSV